MVRSLRLGERDGERDTLRVRSTMSLGLGGKRRREGVEPEGDKAPADVGTRELFVAPSASSCTSPSDALDGTVATTGGVGATEAAAAGWRPGVFVDRDTLCANEGVAGPGR